MFKGIYGFILFEKFDRLCSLVATGSCDGKLKRICLVDEDNKVQASLLYVFAFTFLNSCFHLYI